MIGAVYNDLTVVSIDKIGKYLIASCNCSCGGSTKASIYNVRNGNTKSCGCRRAVAAAKRNKEYKLFGERNPSWRGGITQEQILARNSLEYTEWRKQVFIRDNYSCRRCGTPGPGLEAHHINSFAHSPENRFDVNNGITFCSECHTEFHALFGRVTGTSEDCYNFVGGVV